MLKNKIQTAPGDAAKISPLNANLIQAPDSALLIAEILQWPISSAAVVDQVGPFALIHYTPYGNPDPDILLHCGATPQADKFNLLILQLQRLRLESGNDPRLWIKKVLRLRRKIVAVLDHLQLPDHQEEFVSTWVTEIATKMKLIRSTHPVIVLDQ